MKKKKKERYIGPPVTSLCPYLAFNGIMKCTHKANFERALSKREKGIDKKHSSLCGYALCCVKGCPIYKVTEYNRLFIRKKK